jgi:hypothetical protein
LARNPEVEDGEGVVEGVVLGDGGVVEHDGARKTAEGQFVEERGRGGGSERWEESLADDDDGDAGNTDVFLRSALR